MSSFAGLASDAGAVAAGRRHAGAASPVRSGRVRRAAARAEPRRGGRCRAPLVGQLAEAGALAVGDGLSTVLAVWRAPERLARAPAWREPAHRHGRHPGLRRDRPDRRPPRCRRPDRRRPVRPVGGAARQQGRRRSSARSAPPPTAPWRCAGPMVPRFAFPPGVERTSLPQLKVATSGFVDTGYRLLERPGQRAPGGHRAAAGHGQRRRLSLPDARPAGRDRRGRRDRDAGGAARRLAATGSPARPPILPGSGRPCGARRQSAAGRRLPRAAADRRRRPGASADASIASASQAVNSNRLRLQPILSVSAA